MAAPSRLAAVADAPPSAVNFAQGIKRRYAEGLPLIDPDRPTHRLEPEHLLNSELHLGPCEHPVVLCLVSTRDPETSMAMAALARMTPRARTRRMVAGVFGIAVDETRHEPVQDWGRLLLHNDFHPRFEEEFKHATLEQTKDDRDRSRRAMLLNLRHLLDGEIDPDSFFDRFFQLVKEAGVRRETYVQLIQTLLTSKLVRPKVKIMLIDRLERFPLEVRMQVVTSIARCNEDVRLRYLSEELEWALTERPDLVASAAGLAADGIGGLALPRAANAGRFAA